MLEYFDYDIQLEAVTKHVSEFFNVSNSGVYLYSSPDFHPGIRGQLWEKCWLGDKMIDIGAERN